MAKLVSKILTCMFMSLLFGSCILEYPPEMEDAGDAVIDSNRVVLQLNIKALEASNSENPTERIKSLRVVIIGRGENVTDPDTIECNRLIAVPERLANNYSDVFIWESNPGDKDIFIIANEESVADDLTTRLNGYSEGKPVNDFFDWVNEYYFTPTYTADEKNNIYLPYTFSQEGITPRAGAVQDVNAWLVPVATKFIFNFINKRTDGFRVKGISMKYANQANYLLARLGDGELLKEYNGEEISWVDWLAEVSKNSWFYPDFSGNVGYNDEVGWIVDYKVPNPADAGIFYFVRENVESDFFTVPGAETIEEEGEETIIPKQHTTPVYYLPESANLQLPDTDDSDPSDSDGEDRDEEYEPEHRFYLTILFEDMAAVPSTPPVFNDIAIPNLKALFRNTYVIINLTVSEGDIEIYAEIAQWNRKTANGWVNEGNNPPPNNPFRTKIKW